MRPKRQTQYLNGTGHGQNQIGKFCRSGKFLMPAYVYIDIFMPPCCNVYPGICTVHKIRNTCITIKGVSTSNPFSTTCIASNVAFFGSTTCLEN